MARRGGQIEGQIRETIREPDPIQIAQRLAAAGQQVPPELQRQVFQKAAADGMSSEALEQAFGMPPGTASQAAQDLGIAQQLPATLGGSMAAPGTAPPRPQQSPDQVAAQIAASEARSRRDFPDEQIQNQAAQQPAQNQPAASQNNGMIPDEQFFNETPASNNYQKRIPYNSSPYTSVDDTFNISGSGSQGEADYGWGAGAQGIQEGFRPEEVMSPPTSLDEIRQDVEIPQEERPQQGPDDPANYENWERKTGLDMSGLEEPQRAAPNEKPQPWSKPGLDVLKAGGDGTEQGVEIPFQPDILIGKEDMPGYRGAGRPDAGVDQTAGLPGRREDGAYTQAEIDAVMAAVNAGTITAEELSQHYQVPADEINKNITNINMQVDKGLPVADGDYTQEEVDQVLKTLDQGNVSPEEAASIYGVSPDYVKGQMSQAGLQTPLFDPDKSPASATSTGEEIGLAGAEKALAGGLDASQTAIQAATNAAAGQVTGGETQARTDISGGAAEAATALSSGATAGLGALAGGIQTGRGDVTTGTNQGLQALGAGLATGRGDIATGTNQGLTALGQGIQTGRGDVATGTNQGLTALGQGLGVGRGDIAAGANQGLTALGAGLQTGRGDIATGTTQGLQALGAGLATGRGDVTGGTNQGLQALGAGLQAGRQDISSGASTGLQALGQGLGTARGDIASGTTAGLQALGQGLGTARQDIMGGTEAGLGALYGGLAGGRSDLQAADAKAMGQYGAGLGDIQAGRDIAGQQVQQAFGRGEQMFSPYAQGGQQAHQNQLALSGALGQEAFDQAYQASPQMKFLQEQGERSIARNAAATGGLGGGNVQKELLKYGQGVASQDLQNQIGNLQGLSGQGMQAATGASGLAARGGETQAGIETDAAGRLAAQRNIMGGSQTQTGQGLANLNVLRGQGGADMLGGAGQQLANLGLTAGTQGLQAITGGAGQLGQMAFGAGGQGLAALQRAGEQSGQMSMTGGTQGLQALQSTGRDLGQMAMTGGTQGLQALQSGARDMGQMAYGAGGQGLQALQRAGEQAGQMAYGAGGQGLAALQRAGEQQGQMAMTGGTQGLQALQGAGRDMGQMAMTGGTQGLQALQGSGRDLSQMAMTGGTQGLQTMSNLGQNLASVYGQRGLNLADTSTRAAQDRANYNMQGGMQGAQNAYGVGNTLSNQRIGAGRDIASNIAAQSQNLANYASQQGQGLSNLYGGQGQNLQALLAGAGANTANQIGGTAAARQNAAINAASGAYGMIGGVPAKGPGMIDAISQGAGMAGTAIAAFSDRRLKENITQIGRENGFNIYSWNWNEKGIELGADKYPTVGVIAQEVQETRPDAVITENGYLKVDYGKLDIQVSRLH